MELVLTKAACFIFIIVLGYLLKRVEVLRIEDLPVFSRLVIKITLPAAIIFNFSKISMDVSMLAIVAVGFVCSGLYMGVGYLLFIKDGREKKAFGLLNASGYNIGCFTMPFVQSFLGPVGVAATSLFDTGNAMICTGTSYTVAVSVSGKGKKSGPAQMVRQLFSSVPFDCYILMTLLTLFQIRLPGPVVQVAEIIGNANSFLALVMIGLGLELHVTREQASAVGKIAGTRFLISLALAMVIYYFAPFGAEIRRTLAILMFAPVSSLGVPYTSMIEGDVGLASALNSVSIIMGIVCLTTAILVF